MPTRTGTQCGFSIRCFNLASHSPELTTVGKQAQYNAYKQIKQKAKMAQQGQQELAGYANITEETAGPHHIEIQEFDGFGLLGGMY